MTQKHVLIVVTARDDAYSWKFKEVIWPRLKSKLDEMKHVELVEIELERCCQAYSETFAKQYSDDLHPYIKWFPTFILCTHSSWTKKECLNAKVFNGVEIRNEKTGLGELVLQKDILALTEDNIIPWLTKNIVTNKFIKRDVIDLERCQTKRKIHYSFSVSL